MNVTVYQIDSDIPAPKQKNGTALPPLNKLKVGESVAFPIEKRPLVQSSASRIKKARGKVFNIHKQNEETARVWRVL